MGDSFFSELSDGMCIGVKCFDLTHNQLRPMTTQISAPALTDEQLKAVNGAGIGAMLGWAAVNVPTLAIPIIVDAATGGHITKAAQDAPF